MNKEVQLMEEEEEEEEDIPMEDMIKEIEKVAIIKEEV